MQQIEHMLGWSARPQTGAASGKPYLSERKGILSLHFDALSIQSEMCVEMPDTLVVDYTRTMMSFLLPQPSPKRIAMIGLGGGSLAKYCYRYLPQTEISVVEINPEVIALRNEFAIPPDDARFRVLLGDGATWITDTSDQPDVLIADGFDATGLPAQLSSPKFYDDCFKSLACNGMMVVNLWSAYPRYDECVSRIRKSFAGNLIIIQAEDNDNHIVIAVKSAEFPPASVAIWRHAQALGMTHPLNFQAKSHKLIQALPGRRSD